MDPFTVATVGLPILSSILGGRSARSAANTQASAAQAAAEAQLTGIRESNDMMRDFRAEDIERFQPFYKTGVGAQNALAYEMGFQNRRPRGYRGFEATPGYDFRRSQGLDAVQNSVAGRQGLMSGAAMQEMERFGQGIASEEYGNYLARLGGLAGGGLNAAGMQGSASQNYGMNMAQNTMQGGQNQAQGIANAANARAAGTMGMGNAFSSGINNALGAWQFNRLANAFGPGQSAAGVGGGGIY